MNVRYKAHLKWASSLLCILGLTVLLAACSYGEGTTTVVPTPTPTPTPTGTAYTGDGYTLSYPQGWAASGQTPLPVVFTSNSDKTTTFTVTVTPALLAKNLDASLTSALDLLKNQAQNYKPDNTVSGTTTVAGESWQQAGATYDDKSGQHLKGVVLANQHPASTGKIYVITLTAKADSYDEVYKTSFKPILDSFKFS